LIVFVYVDALLIISNNYDLILIFKKQLAYSFHMADLGTRHYFFGLQLLPHCDGFFISQCKYVMDLLTHFKMVDFNPYSTPFQFGVNLIKTYQTLKIYATLYRQLVGSIIYLTHIQLDISFFLVWFLGL
jgi:hypothetical protein